jgi:hypothetical protein
MGESYPYFYFLCLADPANPHLVERARRFAGLYLGENPAVPNYDPDHAIIRAPHNGSGGPRWGIADGEPRYGWSQSMAVYGLPFSDVPGITSYDDLRDPALARRMGEVMHERMGRGDVAANLGVTSLVANAYLLTGDDKYRSWILTYVDAWIARARANGGLLPDNVGLSGRVGEYTGGKWYGGLYGWTWPHGLYNIGMAAIVAGTCAYLLTRDERYLDLPRAQLDAIMALGEVRDPTALPMSLRDHWVGQFAALGAARETFVVPYRHGDAGWFDYQPPSPIFPLALWIVSLRDDDWARLERIREAGGGDWTRVFSFRTKEESGHEQPWTRYLAGANPAYPARILAAAYHQVCRRLDQIRSDDADLRRVHIHHWQELNPVLTEALVQLTLGAPQPIYNGGLLMCPLRHFDGERRRPGLPADVAALVESVDARGATLHLVNLSPFQPREVIVQAGGFAEHRFEAARYSARTSPYPGPIGSYAAPALRHEWRHLAVGNHHLRVHLPPATEIVLELWMARFANRPSYALPWADDPA